MSENYDYRRAYYFLFNEVTTVIERIPALLNKIPPGDFVTRRAAQEIMEALKQMQIKAEEMYMAGTV